MSEGLIHSCLECNEINREIQEDSYAGNHI